MAELDIDALFAEYSPRDLPGGDKGFSVRKTPVVDMPDQRSSALTSTQPVPSVQANANEHPYSPPPMPQHTVEKNRIPVLQPSTMHAFDLVDAPQPPETRWPLSVAGTYPAPDTRVRTVRG